MLIHSATQLLTLAGGPQRGAALGSLEIIENGAVLLHEEEIVAVGTTAKLRQAYPDEPHMNVSGKVIMPGFVDPHTHASWAGDRAAEFELRLQGKTYLEILEAGGGILSTVRATRQAPLGQLMNETRPRLWEMFRHGTTSMEVKTGYGLDTETELKMLGAIENLHAEGPWELATTFLGAHAIPEEYHGDADAYTIDLCEMILPAVKQWWGVNAPRRPLPFVDVFCETGAFNLAQSRRILAAAKELGFPLKIHADEFDNLGGA
ncbi:MAG: amidohydrolase family protein, partial [Anaerolineales bacterium]|nr:amidohydrolase family protein [Anaerolineales bacterium]